MEITEARHEDLPEMIALLKISLGEGLIPKSEEYFIWKHEKNPFGKSKILLAKEDGKIVGLRAFMHWSWTSSAETISAVRAVDTATDPAYQGRGIFKKLTLQAAEECKQEGVGLVFNSPNPISMKGYLKMGWQSSGRMPMYLGLGSIFPRFYNENSAENLALEYDVSKALNQISNNWSLTKNSKNFHTLINKQYLKWRYADCPIVKYGAVIEPNQFGIIFRLKRVNQFIELRICELWSAEPESEKKARIAYKQLIKRIRPIIVTCGKSPLFGNQKNNPLGLLGPFLKGPVTTLKPLVVTDNFYNFENFNYWQPSLGTMELF